MFFCIFHKDPLPFLDTDAPIPYKEISSRRQKKVHEFAHSNALPNNFAVCLVSSIPRWHMVRCLYIDRTQDVWYRNRVSDSVGPGKGLRACVSDTILILSGKCPVANHIFESVQDPDAVRIQVLRALLRTVVYLVGSYSRATAHFSKMV